MCVCFFFFKQKTAYDVRISDWSSDVCSSDLFGCSADTENPMISRKLYALDILDYIISIGERYPRAVHVGYGFRYDMNMIVQTLAVSDKAILKLENQVTIRPPSRPGIKYRIEWLPGKSFTVTKRWGRGKRDATTVRSEEHTSELQSLMSISYDFFCLKKKKNICHITYKL